MALGILKSVPARQQWLNEARDFTPWLSQNIEALNDALGLELEVENIEVACGPYSADILAKDAGTGKFVVIENQLEKTNHDHLGKALTYASVLDASAIIWIATDFTNEHKKALDWLNDHTSEEISFYGVQLELWQIDDSNPAVKFHLISYPNEAVRQMAKAKASDDLSGSKKFQLEFWTKFRDKLQETGQVPSLHTPRAQYWYNVSLGRTHIHLSNTCNTDQNKIGVRVYIRNRIAETMLPYLYNHKDEIEAFIGQPLSWDPNPTAQDKTIVLHHVTDFSDQTRLDEGLNWLVEYTLKFRTVFSGIIQDFTVPE